MPRERRSARGSRWGRPRCNLWRPHEPRSIRRSDAPHARAPPGRSLVPPPRHATQRRAPDRLDPGRRADRPGARWPVGVAAMSAQHTPGPWRYEAAGEQRADNDMRHGVVAECNDLWVAACYRSGTSAPNEKSSQAEAEAEANARLIAAAPELLQAARDFISWGTGAGYRFESGSPLDRARDAID